jgi:PAS domain S-box-containing protein
MKTNNDKRSLLEGPFHEWLTKSLSFFKIYSVISRVVLALSLFGAIFFLWTILGLNHAELTAGLFAGSVIGAIITLNITENAIKNRAKLFADINAIEEESALTSLSRGSGLPAIDGLFDNYKDNLLRFADTLKLIGEEAESLIERYEVLTENLAAGIVIRDEHGKITYCSPYTEVLTGSPLSEIYAAHSDFFIENAHEEDQDKFRRALSVSSLGEAFQFRYRFVHKTGIEMWAEMRTVPIFSENSEFLGTLSITLDITGTMRYQQQVEERNKDLQEFSYMISHDLKAPIFTIKGMLSIIKEDHKSILTGEPGELLTHIDKAAERLSSLVSAVLEYSKVTTRQSNPEPVNTSAVLSEIINEFSPAIKNAGAKITIQENLPNVIGDKLMVYQIFSNLIGNSLKYRDTQKELQIIVSADTQATRGSVAFMISDTGLGISKDKIETIFRPFQRAHSGSVEGSGIGLACVKKLLQKLGGSVIVESQEGTGTQFTIRLPLARGLVGEKRT